MPRLILGILLLLCCPLAPARDWPPQDHAGADWTLADGDTVWGEHTNIGRFVLPESATVFVRKYDGIDGGMVQVFAEEIVLSGTLTASGAGFTGGGGGAGGNWFPKGSALGGAADYGEEEFDGQDSGGASYASPGLGGRGDGAWGGRRGRPGRDGGYLQSETNGDATMDVSLQIGSGGGGGDGGVPPSEGGPGSGGGGGAGGRGAGKIALWARTRLVISSAAVLHADGVMGGNGGGGGSGWQSSGGNGGSVSPAGDGLGGPGGGVPPIPASPGSRGGSGAGGGILLAVEPGGVLEIDPRARISSLGGRGSATNGGTVKLYYADCYDCQPPEGVVTAGRLAVLRAPWPGDSWVLY